MWGIEWAEWLFRKKKQIQSQYYRRVDLPRSEIFTGKIITSHKTIYYVASYDAIGVAYISHTYITTWGADALSD